MTSHETAIAERLRDAADRIPVDTGVPDFSTVRPRVVSRSPRRRVVIAAALASAAAVIAVVVGTRPTSETVKAGPVTSEVPADPSPTPCPPAPESPTSCSPLVAAHLATPPAWFGEPQGGFHTFGKRTGRWVSMAIGEESGDTVTDPIVVSVFDGTYDELNGAETVTIGGRSLRSVTFEDWGDWQVLATNDTPTVVVSGEVDRDTLFAVLAAVEVDDPSGEFSFHLRDRPAGYSEVVSPRPLGQDYLYRRTLASASGDVGITESSDTTDPLLAAAMSGADLTAVDVGGETGWTGSITSSVGPLRMLVWSPGPGVVFEISSQDPQLTYGDLIDLAEGTSTIDPAAWDSTYRD
jgi:hypothetical protein